MLNSGICAIPLETVKNLMKKDLTEKEMLVLFVISGVSTTEKGFREAANILYTNSRYLENVLENLVERNILIKKDQYSYTFVGESGSLFIPEIKPRKKKTLQDIKTEDALLPKILDYVDQKTNKHVWSAAMRYLIEEYGATIDDVVKCVEYLHSKTGVKISSAILREEYKSWELSGKSTYQKKTGKDLLNEI